MASPRFPSFPGLVNSPEFRLAWESHGGLSLSTDASRGQGPQYRRVAELEAEVGGPTGSVGLQGAPLASLTPPASLTQGGPPPCGEQQLVASGRPQEALTWVSKTVLLVSQFNACQERHPDCGSSACALFSARCCSDFLAGGIPSGRHDFPRTTDFWQPRLRAAVLDWDARREVAGANPLSELQAALQGSGHGCSEVHVCLQASDLQSCLAAATPPFGALLTIPKEGSGCTGPPPFGELSIQQTHAVMPLTCTRALREGCS